MVRSAGGLSVLERRGTQVDLCEEVSSLVKIPSLIIAGTHSGVGKTKMALAIMAVLSRRGLTVQPFKVGAAYLDPLQHKRATGRVSRNLDGWMLSRNDILRSFCSGVWGE